MNDESHFSPYCPPHFRHPLDMVPQLVWTAEPDGTIDYVNRALSAYVGISPAAFCETQWTGAVHPDDLQEWLSAWRRAVSSGSQCSFELRLFRQAEQAWCWHITQVVPVRDEHGALGKWYGSATDIHERKTREQVLSLRAERLKSTLESISDAVVTLDNEWRFTFLNEEAQRIAQRSNAALLGKIIWTEFGELKGGAIEHSLRQSHAENRPVEVEAFSVRFQAWFEIRVYPSDDGLTIYLRDISKQKLAQDALRQSQERFASIAKATSDAIWDWDLETDQIWWNKGYETLFGFPLPEIWTTSESWTDYIHPDDKKRIVTGIDAVIAGGAGDTWTDEYRFMRSDGSYAYVLDRGFVIRNNAGKAVRVVGGMTDLTSHKLSEQSLARTNRALRMLSACNKAMIHATDEKELLTDVCRIAVDVGSYRMAWVGYAEADATPSVIPMAYAGELKEADYIQNIRISKSEHDPRGRGPGGQCLRTGKPVVCPDIKADANLSIWVEAGERNGFRGIIALPLCQGNHVFGLMALYSAEVLDVDQEEIDSLQDMANNLAFGLGSLRSQKSRQQIESAVLKVASGVSGRAGGAFFEQLVHSMADALGGQGGFIARLSPENPFVARTISAVIDGKPADNFEYEIKGTPCERFQTDTYCIIRENVSCLFPHSDPLQTFGAQAYVGRRLDDSRGRPVGLIYVLYRQPLKDVDFITSTMQIFAARAEAELERYDADARIRDQAALLDKTQDAVIVCDVSHRVLFWNKGAERLYGWTAEESLGKSKNHLLQADPATNEQATKAVLEQGEWSGQISYRRKDGSLVPVEAHWSLVRDDEGQAQSIFTINTDVTQRKADEREIQKLAFYDILTGLPNRRLLHDRLEKALLDSVRHQHICALLFIDLDNFKTLNDTVGHDKGDLLLQQVATRLKSCVRKSNTVARLGGDEFVIVLDDFDKGDVHAAAMAEAVAEKVLEQFRQPFQLNGVEHRSTPSIGIALFNHEIASVDELLKRADLAMYEAKAAGRNTIRFFDPHMQKVINARVSLESDLRKVLRKKGFALHYQAQTDGDGHLTGVEALIRWKHPVRGDVPPAEFIPLAEDTGLIMPLGEWVLETACAQLAKWANAPEAAALTIAVNVSSRQFRHPDFVPQVLGALSRNRANPNRLKLEITESLLIDDMESTVVKMNALKSEGVSFSLDDFGTGYSSLSYLKRLPLDQLKIDRSFVQDVLTDPNDAAIAKTIVALAHSLGLTVIAEGVETVEQRDLLARYGCNAYQGHLYGRSLSIEQFEDALHRNYTGFIAGQSGSARTTMH